MNTLITISAPQLQSILIEGSQGYLTQHSLLQVAKELLVMMRWPVMKQRLEEASSSATGFHHISSSADIMNNNVLLSLLSVREALLLKGLESKLSMIEHEEIFDKWMKHESDLVQGTAEAYGERQVMVASLDAAKQCSYGLSQVINKVVMLYALSKLEANLGWYLYNRILLPEAGKAVPAAVRQLCSTLGAHSQTLVNSFGIPRHLVAAPIAGDWEAFNIGDNQGELFSRI